MKKYIKVYKKLLQLNAQLLLAYRMNFFNSLISAILWGVVSFVSIYLLTANTKTVLGWSRNDMLLLTAVYSMITGFFQSIFSRNFERLAQIVHFAEFDPILLKPIDSQFSVSLWLCNYANFSRVTIGIFIAAFILKTQFIYILPFFIFISFFGGLLLYSIWLLVSTLVFKNSTLSNLAALLYQLNGFARYPSDIYKQIGSVGFSFFIPLTIMITVPAKLLTHRITLSDIYLLILVTLSALIISRVFWKFALRFYTSASG